MYIPPKYKNENLAEVRDFLKEHAFAILVNQVDGRPWATHIPLELEVDEDGKDILVGHIAKANPQWKYFESAKEVLCIFNGPHSYVSSTWYKEEEVPTWNYVAVHVYGSLELLDQEALLHSLHRLVDKYEHNSEHPLSLNDLSEKTMRQIKGVIGFKILITEIQAAYKLSQGRDHDHPKIILELEQRSAASKEIASLMKKHSK